MRKIRFIKRLTNPTSSNPWLDYDKLVRESVGTETGMVHHRWFLVSSARHMPLLPDKEISDSEVIDTLLSLMEFDVIREDPL